MSFDRLRLICEISDAAKGYLDFVEEWDAKDQSLHVNLQDHNNLVVELQNRKQEPYDANPEITLVNQVPSVRLANACESVSHLVYSMSEIAARFANKVSQVFPASFNALRKKVRDGKLDHTVVAALGDLQWYEKVREIRTEWAHYSSPFVGIDGEEPSIVLRSFRSKDDRVHFAGRVAFKVEELREWATAAFRTIDGLADYVFRHHLLHSFDLKKVIGQPVRDSRGFPIIKDGIIQTEEMTIAEYMFRHKILERCADIDTWSKELGVSASELRVALKDVQGLTGPLPDGTIIENGLYLEQPVLEACSWLRNRSIQ